MLSPCVRQVTHALLTRPPLTFESLGFIKSPFDLHVLSTPPAFILSQDQTLMLKSFFLNQSLSGLLFCLGGFLSFSTFKSCSQFVSLKSPDELFLFNSLLEFFRVALLFIFQGSFCSLLLFSAATLLSYHRFFALSTTF